MQSTRPLPKAVFLDLDDTILDDTGSLERCWSVACASHCSPASGVDPVLLKQAIDRTREWYWSDPERHREGRLDLDLARRRIVEWSLRDIGIDNPELAAQISQTVVSERAASCRPLPEALDTVRWFRERGCRLALLTNGNGKAQREKVSRFGLTELFDLILIEGELGFGKPDPRIYARALEGLGSPPSESWMAGDRLEWDVIPAQKLGIYGIWINASGVDLPLGTVVRPNRIVRSLAELREASS